MIKVVEVSEYPRMGCVCGIREGIGLAVMKEREREKQITALLIIHR